MSAHYRCSEPDTSPAQPGKQWGSVLGPQTSSLAELRRPRHSAGAQEAWRTSQSGRAVVRRWDVGRSLWSSVGTVPALWEPLTSAAQKDLNGLAASFTIFPAGRADPAWAVAAGGEASRAPALASACPLRGRRQAEGQSPSGQSRGVRPGPAQSRSRLRKADSPLCSDAHAPPWAGPPAPRGGRLGGRGPVGRGSWAVVSGVLSSMLISGTNMTPRALPGGQLTSFSGPACPRAPSPSPPRGRQLL